MAQRPMPTGVTLTPDGKTMYATEVVGGWFIELSWQLDGPVNGPSQLRVFVDNDVASVNTVAGTEGLGEIVRTMPLRAMRERLAAAYPLALEATARAFHDKGPRRASSDRHYAEIAKQYVTLVEQGNPHPVAYIQRATGTSRNTINGRLRKARQLGYLKSERGTATLTDKAREILQGGVNQ
jgi:hypothetical protein